MLKRPCQRYQRNVFVFIIELQTKQLTKQAWEKDLGVAISEADRRRVWSQAVNISFCNYTKSIQVKMFIASIFHLLLWTKWTPLILCFGENTSLTLVITFTAFGFVQLSKDTGRVLWMNWVLISVSQCGWIRCAWFLVSPFIRSLTVKTRDFFTFWLLLPGWTFYFFRWRMWLQCPYMDCHVRFIVYKSCCCNFLQLPNNEGFSITDLGKLF